MLAIGHSARRLSVLRRLEDVGRGVGLRLLETLYHRERGGKRDTRLLDVLKFVHTTLWKYLFGRQARDLEQSNAVRCPGRPAGQVGSVKSLSARARARTQASLSSAAASARQVASAR